MLPKKAHFRAPSNEFDEDTELVSRVLAMMQAAGVARAINSEWPPRMSVPALLPGAVPIALRIALFGLWNRGKTTIADALLRTTMLPRWPVPTTLVATHVIAGDGSDRVVTVDDQGAVTEIAASVLTDITLAAEDWSDLRELWVSHDCDLLRHGIELIDLPGVDAARNDELAAAVRSLPAIDLILFVIRSDEALVESEQSLLRTLAECPCPLPIIIVLNDVDAEFDARSRALIRQRVENFPPVATAGAFWARIEGRRAHTVNPVHFASAMSMLRAAVTRDGPDPIADGGSLNVMLTELADSAHKDISAQALRWQAWRIVKGASEEAMEEVARVDDELAEADQALERALDSYYSEFANFKAAMSKSAAKLRKKARNEFDQKFSRLTGWRLHHETPDDLEGSYKDWYADFFAEAAGEAAEEWENFGERARDRFPMPASLTEGAKRRLFRRSALGTDLDQSTYLAANVSRPYRGFWASVFGDPWDDQYIDRVRAAYKREWPADKESFLAELSDCVDSYMTALDDLRNDVQDLIVAEADSRRDPLRDRRRTLTDAVAAADTLLRRLADESRG